MDGQLLGVLLPKTEKYVTIYDINSLWKILLELISKPKSISMSLSKLADQIDALTAAQKELSWAIRSIGDKLLEQQRLNAIGYNYKR